MAIWYLGAERPSADNASLGSLIGFGYPAAAARQDADDAAQAAHGIAGKTALDVWARPVHGRLRRDLHRRVVVYRTTSLVLVVGGRQPS